MIRSFVKLGQDANAEHIMYCRCRDCKKTYKYAKHQQHRLIRRNGRIQAKNEIEIEKEYLQSVIDEYEHRMDQ